MNYPIARRLLGTNTYSDSFSASPCSLDEEEETEGLEGEEGVEGESVSDIEGGEAPGDEDVGEDEQPS